MPNQDVVLEQNPFWWYGGLYKGLITIKDFNPVLTWGILSTYGTLKYCGHFLVGGSQISGFYNLIWRINIVSQSTL